MRKVRLTATQKGVLDVLYRNGGEATLYSGCRTFSTVRSGNELAAKMNGGTVETMMMVGLINRADGGQGICRGGRMRLTQAGFEAYRKGYRQGFPGAGPKGEPRWLWSGPPDWDGKG